MFRKKTELGAKCFALELPFQQQPLLFILELVPILCLLKQFHHIGRRSCRVNVVSVENDDPTSVWVKEHVVGQVKLNQLFQLVLVQRVQDLLYLLLKATTLADLFRRQFLEVFEELYKDHEAVVAKL